MLKGGDSMDQRINDLAALSGSASEPASVAVAVPAGDHTLPKAERLSKRSDIGRLFTQGEAFLVYPVKCTYRFRSPAEEPAASEAVEASGEKRGGVCRNRMMVIVPKRNHRRAVVRNLLKRRMREAYRLNKSVLSAAEGSAVAAAGFSAGVDIAFSYIAKGEPADFRTVERAILSILNKLCVLRKAKTTETATTPEAAEVAEREAGGR